jgi:hypothetical protein
MKMPMIAQMSQILLNNSLICKTIYNSNNLLQVPMRINLYESLEAGIVSKDNNFQTNFSNNNKILKRTHSELFQH